MKEVTDPGLLEQLNKEVTDPNILAQLEGRPEGDNGWPIDLKKSVSNIPESAYKMGSGIYEAVTSPVQTAKGVGKLAVGAVQKAADAIIPKSLRTQPEEDYRPYAEAFGTLMKERYGSWNNFRKTVEEDPVGFLGDLSTILTGGGTAAAKAGILPQVAGKVAKAGVAVDPLNVAAGAAKGIAGSRVPIEAFGLLTGKGSANIKQASIGSPAFENVLRSPTAGEDVLSLGRKGLQSLADTRANNYTPHLQAIQNMAHAPAMDINSIYTKFQDWLAKYRVNTGPGGKLDFAESPLKGDPKSITDLERVQEIVEGWVTRPGTMGPLDMDTLKRQLGGFYHESHLSRAMVEDLYETTRQQLINKVPGYEIMIKDYERLSKVLNGVEKTFALGGENNANSALSRLTAAMREDKNLRRNMIEQVKNETGVDLAAAISGHEMKSLAPASLFGRSAIFTELTMAAFKHNPYLAAGILASSPKVVAEFYLSLAKGARSIKSSTLYRQPAYQFGNIKENP